MPISTKSEEELTSLAQSLGGSVTPAPVKGDGGIDYTALAESMGGTVTIAPKPENRLSGFLRGAGKEALSSLSNISEFGERGIQAIGRAVTPKALEESFGFQEGQESSASQLLSEESTTPQTKAERAGFFTAQLAEFLIPGTAVSKALKAKKVGTLGRTAVEAGTSGGVATIQEGEFDKEAKTAAVIGGAVPVAGKVIDFGTQAVGSVFKGFAGVLGGRGSNVIGEILENPEAAKVGLRGDSQKILKQTTKKVRDAVSSIQSDASEAYSVALKKLPKSIQVDKTPITIALNTKLQDFGVKIGKKGLDFSGSPFVDSEEKVIARVIGMVKNWTDLSPEGLNKLAKKVSNFRKTGAGNEAVNSVVDSTTRNIRDTIGKEVPGVDAMNKSFHKTMDFLDAIRSELSIKRGFESTNDFIKTSKKISQLFSGNKELTQGLIRELEKKTGISVLAVEAGRQLTETVPRSASVIGDALLNIARSVISPKVVGEATQKFGVTKKALEKAFEKVKLMSEAERAALFAIFQSTRDND